MVRQNVFAVGHGTWNTGVLHTETFSLLLPQDGSVSCLDFHEVSAGGTESEFILDLLNAHDPTAVSSLAPCNLLSERINDLGRGYFIYLLRPRVSLFLALNL